MRLVTGEEFASILDAALNEMEAGTLPDDGLYRRILEMIADLPEIH